MCRDFIFVRFRLLAFHFNEFRTCRTQTRSISRQTVKGQFWFHANNQNKQGMSFIAMEPHFGCNPDYSDYERNAMFISTLLVLIVARNRDCPR